MAPSPQPLLRSFQQHPPFPWGAAPFFQRAPVELPITLPRPAPSHCSPGPAEQGTYSEPVGPPRGF